MKEDNLKNEHKTATFFRPILSDTNPRGTPRQVLVICAIKITDMAFVYESERETKKSNSIGKEKFMRIKNENKYKTETFFLILFLLLIPEIKFL